MNIELITYADLESVTGSPGNFNIKIKKRARSYAPDAEAVLKAALSPIKQSILDNVSGNIVRTRHAVFLY